MCRYYETKVSEAAIKVRIRGIV